ncbi:MAG: TIR domain-containing protein [Acidimicrobiales bacterium]
MGDVEGAVAYRTRLRVFVSHATPDKPDVEASVLPMVRSLSLHPWFAPDEIVSGEWHEQLHDVIPQCNIFLLVLSRHTLEPGRWVRGELLAWIKAQHNALTGIVVARLDDTEPDDLLLRLPELQFVDVRGAQGVDRLAKALARERDRVLGLVEELPPLDPTLEPTRAAYLRWVRSVHDQTVALIAGEVVEGAILDAPAASRLVGDPSNQYQRDQEVEHHRARALARRERLGPLDVVAGSRARHAFEAAADQPLATSRGGAQHLDLADLPDGEATSIERLLAERWRSIVLGDPGSGKSLLARRIVRQVAGDLLDAMGSPSASAVDEPAATAAAPERLPILCRASDLAEALEQQRGEESEPTWDDPAAVRERALQLVGMAATLGWAGKRPTDPLSGDDLAPHLLAELARQEADGGRLLLVIDGLDEVVTLEERTGISRMLATIASLGGNRTGTPATTPGVQVLATSRIAGYHLAPLDGRFRQFVVGPLTEADAQAVGTYWIEAHGRAVGSARERTEALATEFRSMIRDRDMGTADIAGNPFLVTSLASAVTSGVTATLEEGGRWLRSDLFDAVVADALDRAAARVPDVDQSLILDLQAATAFAIHRDQRTGVVDEARLLELVGDVLSDLGEEAQALEPEEARKLVHALGLLRDEGRGQGLYGFLHLTVEEYLAGRWLLGARSPLSRLVSMAGDPRWVEPVALGLGHLSRNDPELMERSLSALLDPEIGRRGAALVSRCLRDLLNVRVAHVAGLVRIAVELGATGSVAAGEERSPAGAVLLRPLLESRTRVEGQRMRDVLSHALCERLTDPDEAVMASAAALLAALGYVDQEVAVALAAVEDRDRADLGWPVVRALASIQAIAATEPAAEVGDAAGLDASAADGPEHEERAAAVLTQLEPGALDVLRGLGPAEAQAPALRPPRVGLPLRRRPFARLLSRRPELVARIVDDAALSRVIVTLCGGLGFADAAQIEHERERLEAIRSSSAQPWSTRRRAAVQLDTAIVPLLAPSTNPSAVALDPAHMTTESPLAPAVAEWLGDGLSTGEILDRLGAVALDSNASSAARGDARAALVASGRAPSEDDVAAHLAATDEATDRRVRWRLGRTLLFAEDSLRRIDPYGLLLEMGEGVLDDDVVHQGRALLRTLARAQVQPRRPIIEPPRSLLACALNNRRNDDMAYNWAVALDTQGKYVVGDDGDGLIASLGDASDVLRGVGAPIPWMWTADPLAWKGPELIGNALDALRGFPIEMAHLQTWCLDRLCHRVVEAGYGLEALVILLGAARGDLDLARASSGRYLRVLLADLPGGADVDPAESEDDPFGWIVHLPALATSIASSDADPYVKARARLLLADLLVGSAGVVDLEALVADVADPGAKLDLIHRAWASGVAPRSPALRRWVVDLAGEIPSVADRVRALAQLVTALPGDEALLDALIEAAGADAPDHAAPILTWVVGARVLDPPDVERLLAVLPIGPRCWVAGRVGASLLELEGRGLEVSSPRLVDWAVVTLGALCRDWLDVLEVGIETRWEQLQDPATRAEAVVALVQAGEHRMLPLDRPAIRAIDALIEEGSEGALSAARAVLAVVRVVGSSWEGPTRWRACDDESIADRATLLVVESGELDEAGVGAIDRLLRGTDDLLCVRSGLAIGSIARGGPGPPRFRLSDLGPDVLVALVRAATPEGSVSPRATSELLWAVSDVVIDSIQDLRTALDLLRTDDRRRRYLLRHVLQLAPSLVPELATLLDDLDDDDAAHLVDALGAVASHPSRSGTELRALEPLRSLLVELVEEAEPALAAESARTLGHLPPEPAVTSLLVDLVERAALAPEVLVVGATDGLGTILGSLKRAVGSVASATNETPEELGRRTEQTDALDHVESLLLRVAASPDPVLAGHAVHALAAAGTPVESLAPAVPAEAILRGLTDLSHFHLVGLPWDDAADRAARFALLAPGYGDDQSTETERELVATLLGMVRSSLDERHASEDLDGRSAFVVAERLSVLAAVAVRSPAVLRTAVARHDPELSARLRACIERDDGWVAHRAAARLLLVLSDGDRGSIEALLHLAQDNQAVAAWVLEAIPHFEHVTPEGLQALVQGTQHRSLARAAYAVDLLATLFERGCSGWRSARPCSTRSSGPASAPMPSAS